MLSPIKPRRIVSQAPIKFTDCHAGCGTQVKYRTNPKVCCETCRVSRKREQARLGMDRQRRKRGVPKIKGKIIPCTRCGCDVVLNRVALTKYCRPCYVETTRQAARIASATRSTTPEGRAYVNEWQRRKRARDPSFAVSCHLRVMIHRALGKQKAGKSWREFVPYSLEELMAHLERQFTAGMTWENRGEWHIDHIRPLCSFEFQTPDCSQFREAWALTNLRPLWAKDNFSKNGRRTLLL